MKTFEQAMNIIQGSKRYEFEDGMFGPTVLVITDYYSGERLSLDLANLDEETLELLQVEDFDEEEVFEQ